MAADTCAIIRPKECREMILKKALKVVVILSAVLIAAFLLLVPEKKVRAERADVVVTTFALYDIARHLLQNDAEVQMLIPFGRDVHTFEPTPRDMIRVEKSSLFLYSGAGLEPWASSFADFGNAVDMSRFVHLRKGHAHHDDGDEHGEQDRKSVV